MWSPQILGLNQTVFYALVAVAVLPIVVLYSATVVARKKGINKLTVNPRWQGKIAVLAILVAVLVTVGGIFFFPFSLVGLSFAEINLIMQTFWTALVFVSMWFRMKGSYFVHEITMLLVICAWLVGFSAVLLMGPLTSSSLETFSSTPTRLLMNSLHAIFSIPALVFAGWLVALWRPGSTSFAAKSKRLAQLTAVFWVPSYVVGVLDFVVLHTTFFG
jgi:hypothetical protein